MDKEKQELAAARRITRYQAFCEQVKKMTLTVNEALAMDIFKDCRLLTGQAGLQNEIRWVNILEILDDLRHIEAGEFLITTAFDLDLQDESLQQRMIEQFAAKKLAALAIQTGHYVKTIPLSFIRLAAEYRIPLIEVPPDTSFKSITRALMGDLVHRTGPAKSGGADKESGRLEEVIRQSRELMQRLLAGEDPDELRDGLVSLHIDPAAEFFLLLIKVGHGGPAGVEPPAADAAAGLDEQAPARLLLQLNLPFLLGPAGQNLAVLIQPGKTTPEKSAAAARLLLNELKLLHPGLVFHTGASSSHAGLKETSRALDEAGKALQVIELGLMDRNGILFYPDLGIFQLLLEVKNRAPLKTIYERSVAPLLAYDRRSNGALLTTLRVYLKHFSISKAARELFMHRHTMKYRLNQIEEFTGLSPGDPANSFLLYLGLQIYDYLRAEGTLTGPGPPGD